MKHLHIAEDLVLPLDAVTQTFAILAKRGVGKTHTGSVMAEEMLKLGQPVVIYDPTGAWWGLKSSRDGKSPGFPVVIFGGEHADVPLEETAGATVASVIVDERLPAILDCGLMRKGARIRFMTDFCETLYHKNREALHFFVDEAQTIAPQNLKAMPEAARLLGAMEDIVLQGRRRGLGMTVISPRPAVVNTNLRSACEVIIAMQIIAAHDRKAIQEWVDLHGDDAARAHEMMDSLSSLARGEAWVWSPSWLHLFKRVTFRQRETFDSSATPKVGQRVITPNRVAEINLDALGAQIKATVEKAKADDPKELRRRIAELERQLAAAAKQKPAPAAKETKRVEVPVLKDKQLERLIKHYERMLSEAERHGQAMALLWNHQAEEAEVLLGALKAMAGQKQQTPLRVVAPRAPRGTAKSAGANGQPPAEGLTARQQQFLDSAATLTTLATEVSKETVAAWNGIHPRGGSYGEDLKAMADAGYIVKDGSAITVTPAGMAAAAQLDPAEAIDRAKAGLSQRQRKFFEMIVAAYPDEITKEQMAEACNPPIHPRGGSFGDDLRALVGRGLVEGARGVYRARDYLFAGT